MFSQMTAHLRQRADDLWNGRFDALAAQYLYPLPAFLAGTRMIVRNPREAASMLALQRAAYMERGVLAIHPKVVAMDLPRGNRFRAWVDWEELALPVEQTRVCSVLYYMGIVPDGFRIEMVDYVTLTMPELTSHYAAVALSA